MLLHCGQEMAWLAALLAALFLVTLAAFSPPLAAAVVRSTAAEAELVAAQSAIIPGQPLLLGLRLKLDPGWHVYWKNAGDSGTPPTLQLDLPAELKPGAMQFAFPQRIPIAHLVNYGYEGEVLFPLEVDVPQSFSSAGPITIAARADWLECKESCLPASARLAISLPVSASSAPSRWSSLFESTALGLPQRLPEGVKVAGSRETAHVRLRVAELSDCASADFFPEREGVFVHAKIVREPGATDLRFMLPFETNATAPQDLVGVLTCAHADGRRRAFAISTPLAVAAAAIPAEQASSAPAALSLAAALLFAFIGGLVLNLMPCVFPVLGLKVLGLSGRGGALDGQRIGHASRFVLGVVASCLLLAFVMLALRTAGEQVGWGFQLQSSGFVSALAVLFFVLALNLSGTFEWGFGIQSLAGRAAARWSGPFFDGVLVVLVASPCTAPLMGAAIGYTLSEPASTVIVVFTALAIGIAAPYALLVAYPGLLRRLPKPGPWLETARQFLAFPLYATVLWLAWVLGELAGLGAAIRLAAVLLALTFAIWLWQRRARRVIASSIAGVIVAGAAAWFVAGLEPTAMKPLPGQGDWTAWSAAAQEDHRAQGKSVLVDFTAAWCVTCQVNKVTVLNSATVRDALRASGVVALRADWTRRDPEIARALAALGRNGVPVYALYAADGRVTLLPEILTTQLVVDALRNHTKVVGDLR